MSRLSLALVVLVLLGSLIAWLVFRDDAAPKPMIRDDALANDIGDARGPEREQPLAPDSDSSAVEEASATEIQDRAPVAAPEPNEEADRTEVVYVIDEDGRALSGVSVHFMEWAELRRAVGRQDEMSSDAFLLSKGDLSISDPQGIARLPRPDEFLTLGAVHDGLFGSLNRWTPDENSHLILRPNRGLVVRVVDAGGTPLDGVRVHLSRVNANQEPDLTMTNSEGRALFALKSHIPTFDASYDELVVALDHMLADPPSFAFDPYDPPTSEIEFVIAETPRLIVELHDDRGNLVGEPSIIAVGRADGSERIEVRTEDGRADFRPADPGEIVMIEARPLGTALFDPVVTEKTIPPSDQDGRTRVSVTVEEPDELVVFRLVDGEGLPFSHLRLFVHTTGLVDGQTVYTNTWDVETNRDGRVRVAADALAECMNLSLTSDWYAEEPINWTSVALAAPDATGIVDLGDVTIERRAPPPLVATGRVLDTNSSPIDGVKIVTGILRENRREGAEPTFIGFGTSKSDVDGSFRASGRVTAEPLALEFSKAGWLTKLVDIQKGATNVEILLRRGGIVRGQLVFADPEMARDCTLTISGEPRFDGQRQSPKSFNDYAFEFVGVPPGTCRLVFELRDGDGWEFITPPFEVGGKAIDLQTVDVPAVAHRHDIVVVDEGGQPVRHGVYGVEMKWGPPRVKRFAEGEFAFYSTDASSPVALHVGALGYRTVVLTPPPAREHVVLRPALDVVIRIGNLPRHSDSSRRWRVEMELDEDAVEGVGGWGEEVSLDGFHSDAVGALLEDGAFRLPLRQAGIYEVTLKHMRYGRSGSGGQMRSIGSIDVKDTNATQQFTLTLDAKSIDVFSR